MFPLKTTTFPANAAELTERLNESLRDLFNLRADPVEVLEVAYPHLATLTASLDDAEVKGRPPEMPAVSGPATPALTVDIFRATGSRLAVGPAAVDFVLEATAVDLRRAPDRAGNIVLLLHDAGHGRIGISSSTADLEALIAEVAAAEAGKHGVAVDNVQLSLASSGPRSLAAEVRLRGKKLFMSAALRITGRVDLDEQLNARISGLDCTGDGAIASVACGFLKPQLQQLDGRVFPLMSLPMGNVRLRDVQIAAGERLSVSAEFGSAAG
ncbi:MAG TPA: hypothetical protein VM940_16405 [Chthoniobacterales bacterium]|jgi:hypothetical protein|nr:hypothetical protein [Chthoniobacterales bacterium]